MRDVILIHGALGAAEQMTALATLLSDCRVHVVELQGHGKTPLTGDSYRMPAFVDQLRDFIASRGIRGAEIFGYSMGGYVALLLAAESPELVSRVVTLGTKLAWTPAVAAKETKRLDAATIRTKVAAFAAVLEKRHAGAGGWEAVLRRTAALMTELGARPPIDDALLGRIRARVTLTVGGNDSVVTPEETREAARAIPRGMSATIPGLPHPIEQVGPEVIESLVRGAHAAGL